MKAKASAKAAFSPPGRKNQEADDMEAALKASLAEDAARERKEQEDLDAAIALSAMGVTGLGGSKNVDVDENLYMNHDRKTENDDIKEDDFM